MSLDLGAPEAIADPAGYFDTARRRGEIQWSDVHRGWVVLGHGAATRAFRDATTLSADRIGSFERAAQSKPDAFGTVVDLLRGWMIFRDPPDHTRLREPVRHEFTPRTTDALEPTVRRVIEDVLDRIDDRGPVDLRHSFAEPLPALVIAAVLGVDADHHDDFQRWSRQLASIVFTTSSSATPAGPVIDATANFRALFTPLIDRVRREPDDTLLSRLVHAAGAHLDASELVGLATMLLFAGHETTTGLLAGSLRLALADPEVGDGLRSEVTAVAVEELMRVAGPARTMVRRARTDHERAGRMIGAGDRVFLSIAAANHDPQVFDDPGRVDLARDPNPQLGFGWGLHHCLGAHLARLEARLALDALFTRWPDIHPVGPVPPPVGAMLGYASSPGPVRLA